MTTENHDRIEILTIECIMWASIVELKAMEAENSMRVITQNSLAYGEKEFQRIQNKLYDLCHRLEALERK